MSADTSFDPFDPAQRAAHHEVMAELRRACPVARLPSGMVAVTRFDLARAALGEAELRNADAARAPGARVPSEDRLFFFEYDPPEHVPLRRLLLDLFARPRLDRERAGMRALVDELLAPLVAAGGGEIVEGFSLPLAGRSMMRLAGFPEADYPRWRGWITDMVRSGFSFSNRNERGEGYEQCYPDMLRYLDDHIERRTSEGVGSEDDACRRIVHASIDGVPLSRTLQRMILFSVVSAGTNTLTNFVSNTVLSLAREPDLMATLRAERALLPNAVEESLRRDSPSMFLSRAAPGGHRVGDVEIEPGGKVLVCLASANRDEAVYPEPEQFRLDRDAQPTHLAFGWGAHLCLGAPLVRTLGVVMLDAWLDAVEQIETAPGTSPVPYLSPQGNGLERLDVRLVARERTDPPAGDRDPAAQDTAGRQR